MALNTSVLDENQENAMEAPPMPSREDMQKASSIMAIEGSDKEESKKAEYFHFQIDDSDEDNDAFMKRIYATTVDGPCQGVLPAMCQVSIEDQLDLFTNCRQPLAFFSFFREHNTRDGVGVEVLPAGAYVVPDFCEYCGSKNTKDCGRSCQRPRLYFQKKRPPFCQPDPELWDANDHAIPRKKEVPKEDTKRSSWVPSLFRKSEA